MNESSNPLVLWILLSLFAAVGLHLIRYTRRRKKILIAFSKTHNLPLRPEQKETIQKTLDRCFSLKNEGMVRSFAQLSSIIHAGPIHLFRTVELLDISPHARPYSTHFPRISALFSVSASYNAFFILDKPSRATQKLPGSDALNPDMEAMTKQIALSCNAPHSLSVTFAHGHGLIYFEPLVTGGETFNDIECLYCIAKKMHKQFG